MSTATKKILEVSEYFNIDTTDLCDNKRTRMQDDANFH